MNGLEEPRRRSKQAAKALRGVQRLLACPPATCKKRRAARRPFCVAALALAFSLNSCGGGSGTLNDPVAGDAPRPWRRTEARADCNEFDPLRRPFFGDLHVHTSYSVDAVIFGTRTTPRDAYTFAKGGEIPLADEFEPPLRRARIDRPLDFAAVTDHAEWLGEVRLCFSPDSPVYDVLECQVLRQAEQVSGNVSTNVRRLLSIGAPNPTSTLPFCAKEGVDCDSATGSAWEDIQVAAEEAYDRSAACSFTSFVGYEHTAELDGLQRHRNVIFRNAIVPALPASRFDTEEAGFPQGLWDAIESDCTGSGSGCDAVIIPHNSNLSGGEQFTDPRDRADAQRRQDFEPLVEIFQQKGASECRFDRLAGTGVGGADELCTFEQLTGPQEMPGTPPSVDEYPRRNLVRNVLKDGLLFEQTLGANPFQMGVIGSTDTHDSTAGLTDESEWPGSLGRVDATPQRRIADTIRNNPGGLAVVWAEENSRDAIFAALRRRETYATSGTRPLLRFFAGALDDLRCGDGDFVERAYRGGTPMGGEIGLLGSEGPSFAVLALKDPGSDTAPGTDLQRMQIVKGWVDAIGQTHERVFDVAGDSAPARIDSRTCAPAPGFDSLCAIWRDPGFDPTQRAFYYARLLENATCRWSTLLCRQQGVDPFASDCNAQAERAGEAFAACCVLESEDPFYERVVQERAWSSPIWYRPETIAGVTGGFELDSKPDGDSLTFEIRIGKLPDGFDPARDGLHLSWEDAAEIYSIDLEPRALTANAVGYGYRDDSGRRNGLRSLRVDTDASGGATLRIEAAGLDLRSLSLQDHFVRTRLSSGAYRAEQTRYWQGGRDRLTSPG